MIKTDSTKGQSIREIKRRDKEADEKELREKCDKWAYEKYGEEEIKKLSNKHKGLWYLPILDDEGNIEKCIILQPVNRNALSYASTKLTDDGLYSFLETIMRDLTVAGDMEIIEEDEYFIPASNQFNKILEGKKAVMLKR